MEPQETTPTTTELDAASGGNPAAMAGFAANLVADQYRSEKRRENIAAGLEEIQQRARFNKALEGMIKLAEDDPRAVEIMQKGISSD